MYTEDQSAIVQFLKTTPSSLDAMAIAFGKPRAEIERDVFRLIQLGIIYKSGINYSAVSVDIYEEVPSKETTIRIPGRDTSCPKETKRVPGKFEIVDLPTSNTGLSRQTPLGKTAYILWAFQCHYLLQQTIVALGKSSDPDLNPSPYVERYRNANYDEYYKAGLRRTSCKGDLYQLQSLGFVETAISGARNNIKYRWTNLHPYPFNNFNEADVLMLNEFEVKMCEGQGMKTVSFVPDFYSSSEEQLPVGT